MTEKDIENIIDSKNIPELIGKIRVFYPTGFDIEKIDKRIKAKIRELEAKFAKYNNTIEEIDF